MDAGSNTTRQGRLLHAISEQHLPFFRGRAVGLPCQLARLAGVAQSTVRYAYAVGNVRAYEAVGATLLIDVEDLAGYFSSSRPGRKRRL